jgi:hypothetical protein
MPDEVTFNYNAGVAQWETEAMACPLGDCEGISTLVLRCNGSSWEFQGGAGGGLICDPFSIVFDRTVGSGSYRISITV